MKKLLDAFLELPQWQAIAILVSVVFAITYVGWRFFWLGYRIGQRDSENEAQRVRAKRRDLESIA